MIDFGTCGVGDPACDLVIAWTLLSGAGRAAFRRRTAQDEGTWARARGWALWKSLITLAAPDAAPADHAGAAHAPPGARRPAAVRTADAEPRIRAAPAAAPSYGGAGGSRRPASEPTEWGGSMDGLAVGRLVGPLDAFGEPLIVP